jgi:hypothetical protein
LLKKSAEGADFGDIWRVYANTRQRTLLKTLEFFADTEARAH